MEYINYKKDKLPLKFAFRAIKKYKAMTGKDILKEGLDGLELEDLEILFLVAYNSGCHSIGEQPKYTEDDVEDILDDVYFTFMELLPKLMSEDTGKKK